MLQTKWRALWNPDMYHGWGKEKNYFEGWYFKVVDASRKHVFAVIPGISKQADGTQHAFVQVLDGVRCKASYHRYTAAEFLPSELGFDVQLGNNHFSVDKIQLDLPDLQGTLELTDRFEWPKMLGAPGVMGWYSFVPFMECYHGVVSMHHKLRGSLTHAGQNISFDGGIGYLEKDWGRSFPRCWVWMQTNHFEHTEHASLMASVAHIPWLGQYFVGYLCGFMLEGKLFRFTTYTGAKLQTRITAEAVYLTFRQGKLLLEIEARQAAGTVLASPISGDMTGKVNESMQAVIKVRLSENGVVIHEDIGTCAGLEVAGPTEILCQ